MNPLAGAFEARSAKVNKIEGVKELKTPLEAWEQLKEYAQKGYSFIPKEDKDYFLKCFGIFDRPQTPKLFMIRVRIPGGQLTANQARVVGELAKEFGQEYMQEQILERGLHKDLIFIGKGNGIDVSVFQKLNN